MRALLVSLTLLAAPQLVLAYEVGDMVAVVQPAEVHSGGRVVGTVDVGNFLTIGRVGEEGLWINFKAAGWIHPQDVVAADKALDHFAKRIAADDKDAEAYFGRGRAHAQRENWHAAVGDFDKALELAPDRASHYLARAYVLTRQRRYDDALEDYAEAIRLDPLEAQAYRLRAGVHVEQKNYSQAVADYNQAARLFPNDAALNNDRAWLLATCPDQVYRNGTQAVKDATLACELSGWQVFNRLGTLAAAYAESGDFEEAVKWQNKALELSPARYRTAQQSRLRLYQSGKPYREFPGVWK